MAENVEIALICCVFDKGLADFVINNDKSFPQLAANKLGWMFIDGFESHFGRHLTVFSVINVSSYPGFSKILISARPATTRSGNDLVYIPYVNIKYLKHAMIVLTAFLMLMKWATRFGKQKKVLVSYSMYAPFPVLSRLMAVFFRVKTILIVPDVPEYMRIGTFTPWHMKVILKINQMQSYYFTKYMDGYVFLTKYMTEKFPVKKGRFAVVEGCVEAAGDAAGRKKGSRRKESGRILLYAGQLNSEYGVGLLLSAFRGIDNPDFRLWIFGDGPMREEVIRHCGRDNRIEYRGVVNSDELSGIYQEVTAVINPRTSGGIFTRYSFPSKILDYLKSGKPAILCKLDGIPEEYFRYAYVIEEENEKGFAKKIVEVLSKTDAELDSFGEKARSWVEENKNSRTQVGKIVRIIDDILNDA